MAENIYKKFKSAKKKKKLFLDPNVIWNNNKNKSVVPLS